MGHDDLLATIEDDLRDIAVPAVDPVTALDTATLLTRFHDVERRLRDMERCSGLGPTPAETIPPADLLT